MIDKVISYIQQNADGYVEELKKFLQIPSVSSNPAHDEDIGRCARYVRDQCTRIGMPIVESWSSNGHPAIYAEWLNASGKPTVLVYGHYDVQPAEPLDLWTSPPFEPDIRDGRIYARGAADDKGQVFIHLNAAEALLSQTGALPVNLKIIIEGEEEIGSPNLAPLVDANADRLRADLLLVSDSAMFAKGLPSICYGLRGLVYFELNVKSATIDMHSGSFGGAVPNAANALSEILAALKDSDGRVTVPGFYDDVVPLTDTERTSFAELPFEDEKYRKSLGIRQLTGETGYTTLERLWARPTLDINGILAGHTAVGAKTVIPATAMAKVSMRLVPDQDPEKIADLFEDYIHSITPQSIQLEITRMHGAVPYLAPVDSEVFGAARTALQQGFGAEPVLIREGGSIPIVTVFAERLGLPCLLLGFGLPDENAHAPNEFLDLHNFHKGIESIAYLYNELGKQA